MEPNNVSFIESYAVFQNGDKSLMKLNPVIESSGYRFEYFTLDEVKEKFPDIINWGRSITAGPYQPLNPNAEFYYKALEFLGDRASLHDGWLLLKKNHDFEHIDSNDHIIQNQLSIHEVGKVAANLLLLLRLLKDELIFVHAQFQVKKESRIIRMYSYGVRTKYYLQTPYSIVDEDVNAFADFWQGAFTPNALVDLAVKNFNASYDVINAPTRYLLLMTCLESIFNNDPNQITHTISRHLSLIISETKEAFSKNYTNIKSLYSLRSKITHGQSEINERELVLKIRELSELVRLAIKYCQKTTFTKKQLFDYLKNEKGFEN